MTMTTEAKLMSECGGVYFVDTDYKVEIDAGDFLVVSVGFGANKAAAKFSHPNIAATEKVIHEFKHYRKGGSKFWTSRAGVDHYLVIPKSAIKLLPEKGYSYTPAEINGVKVAFNVTGVGNGGWTDIIHINTSISVNHKIGDFKKLCEVAVRGTVMEPIVCNGLEAGREAEWDKLAAAASPNVKDKVYELIEAGKKPVVRLASGYQYGGKNEGEAIELTRKYKMTKQADGTGKWSEDGIVQYVVMVIDGHRVRVKRNQIDWDATVKANEDKSNQKVA